MYFSVSLINRCADHGNVELADLTCHALQTRIPLATKHGGPTRRTTLVTCFTSLTHWSQVKFLCIILQLMYLFINSVTCFADMVKIAKHADSYRVRGVFIDSRSWASGFVPILREHGMVESRLFKQDAFRRPQLHTEYCQLLLSKQSINFWEKLEWKAHCSANR